MKIELIYNNDEELECWTCYIETESDNFDAVEKAILNSDENIQAGIEAEYKYGFGSFKGADYSVSRNYMSKGEFMKHMKKIIKNIRLNN